MKTIKELEDELKNKDIILDMYEEWCYQARIESLKDVIELIDELMPCSKVCKLIELKERIEG